MSSCTRWVDNGVITCTDWAQQATATCNKWADNGSYQCQAWADKSYSQCCDWAPCSWFCDAFVWIANWVCQAWYWVANIVCVAVLWLVQAVCVVWSWVADWVCIAWDNARCMVRRVFHGPAIPPGPIKHVFVLMLENRAFDHMLGFAGINGTDAVSGYPTTVDDLTRGELHTNPNPNAADQQVSASKPADFTLRSLAPDPGHEFNNALLQLCGYTRGEDGTVTVPTYPDQTGGYPRPIDNSGFIASYFGLAHQDGVTPNGADPERIMKCFDPEQLPVLTALAREFALCDNWFSSMPGPTWPNRFFIHAGSSGGLDDSPSSLQSTVGVLLNGFRFENGTIYDALEDRCFDWTVFMGDQLPQVFAISGMTDRRVEGHFDDLDEFAQVVNDPAFSTPYVFIEPNYGNVLPTTPGDFTCGNSQHPLDDVTRGERLIKTVYETIRNSPHWEDSMLLVTYDEHGGFYDHVAPPATVSPGDVISDESNNHHNFDFTQLGIRVPAIVVSPLIPANLIDHTVYDHTSLLATMEVLFGLTPLTNRDANANAFSRLFSLEMPRANALTSLPEPSESGFRCDDDATASARSRDALSEDADERPVEPILGAFLHVAFLRDYHHANPLARRAVLRRYLAIGTRGQAVRYMQDVAQRLGKPKTSGHANPKIVRG